MRVSDWSSDVCSSDLQCPLGQTFGPFLGRLAVGDDPGTEPQRGASGPILQVPVLQRIVRKDQRPDRDVERRVAARFDETVRPGIDLARLPLHLVDDSHLPPLWALGARPSGQARPPPALTAPPLRPPPRPP